MKGISNEEVASRVSNHIPNNHPDYPSVVSDVVYRLWKNKNKDISIQRIIHSALIDNWRKKKAVEVSTEVFFFLPDNTINYIDTIVAFNSFLESKSDKDRKIIIGRALGYTFEEIAEISGMSSQQCYKYYRNRKLRWQEELKLSLALF